jgi:hypothetical protein
LVPPFISFVVGIKVFKLNSIIADGASTGAHNSTPGLNAMCAESQSAVAAVPPPLGFFFFGAAPKKRGIAPYEEKSCEFLADLRNNILKN